MTSYLLKRILGAVIVMWAVATLVFFMLRAVPGDPLQAMLFDIGDPHAADVLRHKYGLDKPVYVQYALWMWNVAHGDLGASIYGSRVPVTQIIAEAFPRTMALALFAFVIAMAIAVPAGIVSAVRKNTPLDHGFTFLAFLGLSMPDFWLGIVLIIVFAVRLHWLPAIGFAPLSDGIVPWLRHLILPATAIGTAFSAILARMIRSSMLEVMKADFITVARSKGLVERRVVLKHGFRNALIPVVTVVGIAFALLMAGAVVVENVFAIKGLGRVLIQGILNRDYPVVQGAILVVSAVFVLMNLLVDVAYTFIDPRIRLR